MKTIIHVLYPLLSMAEDLIRWLDFYVPPLFFIKVYSIDYAVRVVPFFLPFIPPDPAPT